MTVETRGGRYCVVHGHPKKKGSKTDKPKGSIIKCFKDKDKARKMHTAIVLSELRAEGKLSPRKKSNPPKVGTKVYKEFHGKSPSKITSQKFHIPEGFVRLGRAVAIEYECDKLNGGGDGKKAVYRHRFGRTAILCCDEKHKNQLYILSPKIIVTDAGIEG